MAVMDNTNIKRIIFGSLLSLAIYGTVGQLIEWGSEKAPWETKKTKLCIMILIAIFSLYVLFGEYKHNKP
jgi:hypothetical protein